MFSEVVRNSVGVFLGKIIGRGQFTISEANQQVRYP